MPRPGARRTSDVPMHDRQYEPNLYPCYHHPDGTPYYTAIHPSGRGGLSVWATEGPSE
jgi:hypothetical protein